MYSKDFFYRHQGRSSSAAKEIVPIILELAKPTSVVDVGCGTGNWLAIFMKKGISNVLGIDGPWVKQNMLDIPQDKFINLDLESSIKLNQKFDLAVSLEVAEHLKVDSAEVFIESLTNLAPVVVFSAAIPGQGGTNHLNEQWPEYWQNLFKGKGYILLDPIRGRIWNNENVEWWYAQNIFVFVKETEFKNYPNLFPYKETLMPVSLVHPMNFLFQKRSILLKIKELIDIKLRALL